MCGYCARKSENVTYANELETYDTWLTLGQRFSTMSRAEIAKAVEDLPEEDAGGEDFLSQELVIAAVLGIAFNNVGKAGTEILLKELEAGGAHRLAEAVDKAEPYFQQVFAYKDTEARVRANLRSAMLVGGDIAGSRDLLTGVFRVDSVLKDMTDATKYFTNRYFNDQVVPELQAIVEKIFSNPGISGSDVDAAAYKAVREAMEARLKSVPYWRVVANAAASRGFHYGAIKAGMVTGRMAYKIVAVLDSRTSKICRHMNGKEFWLADAEVQVNKAAAAQGDEIKTVSPWLDYKAIKDMDANSLREAGFLVPPFHGNCRSTIQFI